MELSQKLVMTFPLTELWTVKGPVDATRERTVGKLEVEDLLRRAPVRFVVADVGKKPNWRPTDECYTFWRSEVRPRLVDAGATIWYPSRYPAEYCYLGSEWIGARGAPIILLETYH